jgi:hypothetical protein
MSISRSFPVLIITIFLLVSCGNNQNTAPADTATKDSTHTGPPPQMAFHEGMKIEVKTFVVKDSADKLKGYGYDLYIDGKKTIHQPIIPAVPGNDAFASESDAQKTGDLAAAKMKATGSFPSLTIHELDSIGIKHH